MFLALPPFFSSGAFASGAGATGASTGASGALVFRSFLVGAFAVSSAIQVTSSRSWVHAEAHIPLRDQTDLAAAEDSKRVALYKHVGRLHEVVKVQLLLCLLRLAPGSSPSVFFPKVFQQR